jgi:hypothetical protein
VELIAAPDEKKRQPDRLAFFFALCWIKVKDVAAPTRRSRAGTLVSGIKRLTSK